VEAHADGDLRGVPAGDTAADDDGPRGLATPGTPPGSTPRPPTERIRWYAPTCGASRPATSDIGASSGSARFGQLDGLVGDRRGAGLEQRVGALLGRGQVQVGEERLVLAEAVVLLGDGLLDLEQQVGGGPDLVGGGEDPRAGGDVLVVRDRGADPAFCSMKTWWPWRTSSCTPAGVMATRNSLFLTSRGMPTFTSITVLGSEGCGARNISIPGHAERTPGDTTRRCGRASLMKGSRCLAFQCINLLRMYYGFRRR
jgi:hypothetical protein